MKTPEMKTPGKTHGVAVPEEMTLVMTASEMALPAMTMPEDDPANEIAGEEMTELTTERLAPEVKPEVAP